MTTKIPDGVQADRLCGDYVIYQPQDGQRYTTDDMLVGWLAVRELRQRVCAPASFLDLGSGLCSVPMIVLWAFPHIRGFGIEISLDRFKLGERSLAENGLAERFRLMQGDLRDVRLQERFSLVTSSPPYYERREGPVSPNADKAGVRFELHGTIDDYCRAAAAHLEQGGIFATVYPFQYRLRALHAAQACGLSLERQVQVVSRDGKPPLLSLFILSLQGPGAAAQEEFIIRGADHLFTEEFRRARQNVGFPDKLR
jgi:tRNA1Val (adenine37-N6)-methyltransferase